MIIYIDCEIILIYLQNRCPQFYVELKEVVVFKKFAPFTNFNIIEIHSI